ncbi:MAG: hypothetical protein OK457_02915 [Thaumarchaeota archaeon]|nr:hypothetical protein [Nitrososphaerota archaeon]
MATTVRAGPDAPIPLLVTYPATVTYKPSSITITQLPGSGCGIYPKCGTGMTIGSITNKGTSNILVTGKCSTTVKPGFNGKISESLPCSFPPGNTIAPGKSLMFTFTITLDNVAYGKYKITTFFDVSTGLTTEKTKTGTLTVTASG